MHEDQFQEYMLQLVRIANMIEQLPVADLTKAIQSRGTKLRFKNTNQARQVQKSLDVLLGLSRTMSQAQSKVKRPLRTLFNCMPELKAQLNPDESYEVHIQKGTSAVNGQELIESLNQAIGDSVTIVGGSNGSQEDNIEEKDNDET